MCSTVLSRWTTRTTSVPLSDLDSFVLWMPCARAMIANSKFHSADHHRYSFLFRHHHLNLYLLGKLRPAYGENHTLRPIRYLHWNAISSVNHTSDSERLVASRLQCCTPPIGPRPLWLQASSFKGGLVSKSIIHHTHRLQPNLL